VDYIGNTSRIIEDVKKISAACSTECCTVNDPKTCSEWLTKAKEHLAAAIVQLNGHMKLLESRFKTSSAPCSTAAECLRNYAPDAEFFSEDGDWIGLYLGGDLSFDLDEAELESLPEDEQANLLGSEAALIQTSGGGEIEAEWFDTEEEAKEAFKNLSGIAV
jgi:hypothetical protein